MARRSDPGQGWLIGNYMSPLDVHFNYAPLQGRISGIVHNGAKLNLPMVDLWEYFELTYLRRAVDLFAKRYALENERQTVFIEGRVKVAMVEIAAVHRPDQHLRQGGRDPAAGAENQFHRARLAG